METQSDAALVREVVSGNREQFGALVERYLPTVVAVAWARLRNPDDAEDIAQETFLNAYRNLDRLREPGKFEAWVATIARNGATRYAKKRAKESAAIADLKPEAVADSGVVSAEMRQIVSANLSRLRPNHREVLLLHYFAGRSIKEIAATLGVSESAVKKRLQRGREALGEALLGQLTDESGRTRDLSPLKKTIMAAALAQGATWVTTDVAMAAGAGVVMKAVAIAAVAAVAIGAAFGVVYWLGDEAPEPGIVAVEELGIGRGAIAPDADEATSNLTNDPVGAPPPDAAIETAVQSTTRRPLAGPRVELVEKLSAKVSVVFEDIHLAEIIEFMSETYDIHLYLDARAIAPVGPDDQPYDPKLWIGADESLETVASPEPEFVTDGMFEEVDLRDVPLGEALAELLHPIGLDFIVEPGFIWVSTPGLIAREVGRFTENRFKGYSLIEKMDTPVSLVFSNIHLSDILEFAADTYDINVAIDQRTVNPPPQGVSNANTKSPTMPAGAVTDGMVRYVNLRDVQMQDALRGLLRPLSLDYLETGNVVIISSRERIAAKDVPLAEETE